MSAPPETTPIRERHRIDLAALERHLVDHVEGFRGPLEVRQFSGGQSNPSFFIQSGSGRYVLRKQPPGKLLPSAHRVDREYRVITALGETGVPVPRTHLLCEDTGVVGTSFFLMDYVAGRIFRDPTLPHLAPGERSAIFDSMGETLAALHAVDVEAVGLADYGKPGNYFSRQIGRWTSQYELSKTLDIPEMDRVMEWLPKHVPDDDDTRLVHGDYRLENMIFHPTQPRVLAILDWELSTLGHPLADLAYNVFFDLTGPFPDSVRHAEGIPPESEYLASYAKRSGRDVAQNWDFYLAFSAFRLAAISQGVYKRALDGIASSETAGERGNHVHLLAKRAWSFASRSGSARDPG